MLPPTAPTQEISDVSPESWAKAIRTLATCRWAYKVQEERLLSTITSLLDAVRNSRRYDSRYSGHSLIIRPTLVQVTN